MRQTHTTTGGAGSVRRLTSKLATVRRLSWPERWLLFEAGLLVVGIGLSLRVLSFQRLHAVLLKLTPPTDHPEASYAGPAETRVLQTARIVSMASRHTLLPNSCLHRSLALWWLLRRRGFDSRLHFGARRQNGGFEAHAWVEHSGQVVSDDPMVVRDYAPLPWASLEDDA